MQANVNKAIEIRSKIIWQLELIDSSAMSKIDKLLSAVDDLSARSDTLVSSICESNTLIALILELNGDITTADAEIDTMTELINKNNFCLNEFEKLYEKSFFLESNLHLNQHYTNETSLDNLNREYSYLLSSFGHFNVHHLAEEVQPPSENKELKNMLSISNLALKPLRCRTTKMTKQKSRYRLSSAYTLNPVQEGAVRDFLKSSYDTNVSSVMDRDTTTSSESTVGPDTSGECFAKEKKKGINENSEAGPYAQGDHIERGFHVQEYGQEETKLDQNANPHMSYDEREREKVSGTRIPGTNTVYSQGFNTQAMYGALSHESSYINDTNYQHELKYNSGSEDISALENNTFAFKTQDIPAEYLDFHYPGTGDDTFKASPQLAQAPLAFADMSPVNLDSLDLDEMDDFDLSNSDCSPSSDLDFRLFLRQSRVDLRTAFPAPLQKSRSHDSVFSGVPLAPPLKFHNPALMLARVKKTVNEPTVEATYSNSYNASPFEVMGSNFKERSRRLLEDVTRDLPESPTKLKPITPRRKSNFTIFNLLNSPMGSPSGMEIHKEPQHRGSIDLGKSLAGLLSLVGSKTPVTPTSHTAVHFSPPEKIKKLRKDINEPIAIQSEVHHKRLPPPERHLRNGSHSSLTIGPGNQKIISHGESSIFKRPAVNRLNRQLLASALSESIIT